MGPSGIQTQGDGNTLCARPGREVLDGMLCKGHPVSQALHAGLSLGLAWGKADKKTIKLMHWLKIKDLDVIYDLPFFLSKEKFVFSAIGENDNLKRLLKVMKLMGKVRSTHFQKATFTEYNILSCLTDKQKEVVIEARKLGYYDYPKKVSSQELADNLGISRATTIEHLRKAEARLMETILAGY